MNHDRTQRTADGRHLLPHSIVRVVLSAAKPDLTVILSLFDPSTPVKMRWILATESFDGLPPKLAGNTDLGQSPRDEANELFRQLANLPRGKHLAAIEPIGERLWEKSPVEFRDAYWALTKHYGRPLTIQFTIDHPHLPWELMKPTSSTQAHQFLAERHAVARWIGADQAYLSNKLPAGDIVVVALHYQSV